MFTLRANLCPESKLLFAFGTNFIFKLTRKKIMSGRKKNAVRKGKGIMCNICGKNCGRGGALKVHIEGAHDVNYEDYKKCFYGEPKNVLADSWDDSVQTSGGKTVITHVFVRRFVGDPGPRGVTRSARVKKK